MKTDISKEGEQNLAEFLEEGLNYVDHCIPTLINSGGCGVFARDLSIELTKYEIPHQIFAVLFPKQEIEKLDTNGKKEASKSNKKLVDFLHNNGPVKGVGCHHVVTKVKGVYVDSTGIVSGEIINCEKLELTLTQLNDLVEHGEWNPIFDRGCEKDIKEKLDEVFSVINDFKEGQFVYPDSVKLTEYTIKERRKQSPFGGLFS